ncbi:MAG: hypothetical protein U1C74_21820 [Phenylobacterium sp.]|nr:hypothetical protein [Phenylobacterium sp.]
MTLRDPAAPRTLAGISGLSDAIAQRAGQGLGPHIVGLDGRSGVGKSTVAAALAERLEAAVIAGDDFFAGGVAIRDDSPESRAAACIDWTRQRCVLEALRTGREADWRAFDWEAFDGRLCDRATRVAPRPVVILEGVYSARPELHDLLDTRVLLTLPDSLRNTRLRNREGALGPWERQWQEAEDVYFAQIMPLDRFDLILFEPG